MSPSKTTVKEAKKLKKEGKSATTQAGPFVEEEIKHVRQGKHGARSTKQAIAIGLSKARASGVPLPPPKRGRVKESTRKSAEAAYERGQGKRKPKSTSTKRAKAVSRALKREPHQAASKKALSKQAKTAAAVRRKKGPVSRSTKKASRKRR